MLRNKYKNVEESFAESISREVWQRSETTKSGRLYLGKIFLMRSNETYTSSIDADTIKKLRTLKPEFANLPP